MRGSALLFSLIFISIQLNACGFKDAPQAPVPATPQESEDRGAIDAPPPAPTVTPSPSPTPKRKTRKRSTSR